MIFHLGAASEAFTEDLMRASNHIGIGVLEIAGMPRAVRAWPKGGSGYDQDLRVACLSLSTKCLLPDPWDELDAVLPPGTSVTRVVSKLTNFGAFVKLDLGIDALVYISELSEEPLGEVPPLSM